MQETFGQRYVAFGPEGKLTKVFKEIAFPATGFGIRFVQPFC
jgi:hypothetical protein